MSSPACPMRARPAAVRTDLLFGRRVDVDGDERFVAAVADFVTLSGFDQQQLAGSDADRPAFHGGFAVDSPGLSAMVAACDRGAPATTSKNPRAAAARTVFMAASPAR